ncbi:MAG: hypothetical protein FGF50_06205 [Candidatus Brockarchaeota archaeon]|nr:hypothetical protein [Candidatus Brockarchaeota archaeon]
MVIKVNMQRHPVMITIVIILLVIGGAFLGYQYYVQYTKDRARSERIFSLMKHVNTMDSSKASSFDDKYNYLTVNGKYNQSVLEFFSYWCLNTTRAEIYLDVLGSIQNANEYLSRYCSAAINYIKMSNLTLVLSLYIDKDEYVGGENMNLTILILSSEPLGRVSADIRGFNNRYGGHYLVNRYINHTGIIEFDVFEKAFVKSFQIYVPSCSPCTGVYPGLHYIVCTIAIKNSNISLSTVKCFTLKS